MRIIYSNLELAKSASKKLSSVTNSGLSACQNALAIESGYSDWHELEKGKSSAWRPNVLGLGFDSLASLISGLARRLEAPAGDIQHALTHTPLISHERFSLEDKLALRASVYRKMEIPDLGRRRTGAVGKFKHGGRPLILKSFSGPTFCVAHGSPETLIADFQYVTPKVPIPLFIPRRLFLAYGVWTEVDGAKVLFARDYLPIWRLRPGLAPEKVSPMLWIDYVGQEWFWENHSAPWESESRWRTEIERLVSFGIRGLPKLAEVLPRLVFGRSGLKVADVAEAQFGPMVYGSPALEDA